MYQKRIQKEFLNLQKKNLPNVKLDTTTEDLSKMIITILGAEHTLYAGEVFKLQFTFPPNYPLEAPEVIFVGNHIPTHSHIYTNGHICLDILYDNWSPVLTVESICLSILSMLSSATVKERPHGNDSYVRDSIGRSPKLTRWGFHDDKV